MTQQTRLVPTPGALNGVRVVEMGQLIAGPFCGKTLGEFGADVVKIEAPGAGDPLRNWRLIKNGTSVWWQVQSRNKRSVALDLRQQEGQDIARRLIAEADVLVENFRPGTLEGWGMSPEELHALNPGLVILRISGYGQTGPYRDLPGFGVIGEAMGGLRHLTAELRRMLAERKVDLIPVVLPFAVDPELRRIARPLFYNRDVVGVTQLLMWTARQSLLEKNRAAMVDFMEDTLRIARWYLDPANHKEVMEIAGRVTKQPPERFDWAFTERDYYHDANMLPNLDALATNVAMMKDLGFVKSTIDVQKHSDLSIVTEAAARLK